MPNMVSLIAGAPDMKCELRGRQVKLMRVTKRVGKKTLIDGVSLDIQAGGIVALFGPSGCGKTTTLRLVAGLETPDSGEIWIGNERVAAEGRNLLPPRETRIAGNYDLVIYSLAYPSPAGGQFLVEAGVPDMEIEEVLRGLLMGLSLALPLVIGVSIGGGYLLMRRALSPVHEIAHRGEMISSHNLNERLPLPGTGDELERLTVSLNRMIERIENAFQHVSRFTADASHELRTPLTALRGELEATAQSRQLTPEARDTIGSALEETERLSKIVQGMLALSRLDAGEAEMERVTLDLSELVTSTAEQMRLLAEDKNISLSCNASEKVTVEGDRARLKQVVVNLLDNAINYTAPNGRVQLLVRADGSRAVLEVEDNGAGIPKEALPHIFERFYRTDKARSRQMGGSGLGLSIVQAICSAHGGEVLVESVEGRGSLFTVRMPLAGS
jgi:heavy metal sensor kinase